ncbi:hypothetical protein D3C87_1344570 [compost metagenome]
MRVVEVLSVCIELTFQLSDRGTQQTVFVLDVLTQFIVSGFVTDQDCVTQSVQCFHEVFETVEVTDVVEVRSRRESSRLTNDGAPLYSPFVQIEVFDHFLQRTNRRTEDTTHNLVGEQQLILHRRIGNYHDGTNFFVHRQRCFLLQLCCDVMRTLGEYPPGRNLFDNHRLREVGAVIGDEGAVAP